MKYRLFIYACILVLGVLLGACTSVPEPDKFSLKFDDVSATVGQREAVLHAHISSGAHKVSECGFLFGENDDNMTEYPAELMDGSFSISLSDLKYSQEYLYKAYAGNGRNVIYSDLQTFVSPARPEISLSMSELCVPSDGCIFNIGVYECEEYDIIIPENVDWITVSPTGVFQVSPSTEPVQRSCDIRFVRCDDGSECVLHVVQQGIIYELGLSSYETYVDGTEDHIQYQLQVTGNANFEVIVPEDVFWVHAVAFHSRRCNIYVYGNWTKSERTCDIVFKSLDHDFSVVHKIVQSATERDRYELDISHVGKNIIVNLTPDINFSFANYDHEDIFFNYVSLEQDKYHIMIEENKSFEARTNHVVVMTDAQHNGLEYYYLAITQHACLDIINFKDPVVKDICVKLWDADGDGELSYEESESVMAIDKDSFAGYDIQSFDEFQWFSAISILPDYLFEGSSLESVSLSVPRDGYGETGVGIFKDCRNLKSVDPGFRRVMAEAFMNCISLKDIDASIVGEKAFMGCTALETVIQKVGYLPEMVFKNCTALHTVTLDERYVTDTDSVGAEAFYGCSSLPEIYLLGDVQSIGDRAFYGCSSLKSVYLMSKTPPEIGEDVFTGVSPDMKIYVPAPLVNRYKSRWPDLADRIEDKE